MFSHWRLLGAALLACGAIASLLACGGCQIAGAAVSEVQGAQQVAPAYTGFKGQSIAIMVWADDAITMDHPRISPDLAHNLQNKFREAIEAKLDEVKGATFVKTDDVVRFQEAHPEAATDSPEELALQFPATRLIYIEVVSLSLHPSDAVDLSKGQIVTDVKVVEVTNGKGKIAYENDSVSAVYPSKSPPEGTLGLDENTVYQKSVDAVSTEIAKLFMTHDSDDEEKNPYEDHT
jgi:hypothetical protein